MNDQGTFWLPPQVSTLAPEIDGLFYFILWWSVIFFVGVVGAMLYFAWKYRRKADTPRPPVIEESTLIETLWAVGPTILVLVVFNWGFRSFVNVSVAPPNSYEIYVTGKQWLWEFEYPNGMTTVNEMTVPADQPVRLILTSDDVIHSFSVPAFRVKHDAVPNRYTSVWFEATEQGTYRVFCTEYCGTAHADMMAMISVVSREEFNEWLVTGGIDEDMPLEELGAMVFTRSGCQACHSVDGTPGIGPTLQGYYGSERHYTDGTSEIADENTVRLAIENPQARVAEGYQPVMPAIPLQEREMQGLIEYIKSLE